MKTGKDIYVYDIISKIISTARTMVPTSLWWFGKTIMTRWGGMERTIWKKENACKWDKIINKLIEGYLGMVSFLITVPFCRNKRMRGRHDCQVHQFLKSVFSSLNIPYITIAVKPQKPRLYTYWSQSDCWLFNDIILASMSAIDYFVTFSLNIRVY